MFGNTHDNFKCFHGALRVSDLESAPSLSSSLESFDHPEILVNAVNSFSKKRATLKPKTPGKCTL